MDEIGGGFCSADGRPSGRIKVALNRPESQRRAEKGGENGRRR